MKQENKRGGVTNIDDVCRGLKPNYALLDIYS